MPADAFQQDQFDVVFFDGKTAADQILRATLGRETLSLLNARNEIVDQFDLVHLTRSTSRDQLVLSVEGPHDDRRITIDKAAVQAEIWKILNTIPDRPQQSMGRPLRFILACALFILACITSFSVLIPAAADRLASLIPRSFEQTLGDRLERTVLKTNSENICGSSTNSPDLLALAERLNLAVETSQPVSLHVIDLPVANAFALPSARIFITRPLLSLIQTPDELVSILAHEMGHVQAHHALRLSLRIGGSSAVLGFLLGDFTGSMAVVAIGQTLIGTAFSREFEREADEIAVQILQNLNISPEVLAVMLQRLERDEQQVGFLATHPLTAERVDFLQQAAATQDEEAQTNDMQGTVAGNGAAQPGKRQILSIEAWKSLKLICD